MTPEELPPYLMPVVAPIYRTVNDEQNKVAGFGKSLLIVHTDQ
jgi:U3 small nucleolar RNA-associated protein 20